ncbi:MAG: hypothetical protein ACJA1R_002672 [Flavobacteriales bacterium]|jgi:hypothetical protein
MRTNVSSRGAAAFLLIVLFLAAPSVAAQAGQRELSLAAGPTFAALPTLAGGSYGVGGQLSAHYGVSEWWSIGVTGAYARHFGLDPDLHSRRRANVVSLYAGPALTIDVVRIIPYILLNAGIHIDGGAIRPEGGVTPTIRAALGADMRLDRGWFVGMQLDWHGVFPEFTRYPGYVVLWFRVGHVIETDRLR